MVKRLVRSTSVPMADLSKPMINSPSQWLGTARSSISVSYSSSELKKSFGRCQRYGQQPSPCDGRSDSHVHAACF